MVFTLKGWELSDQGNALVFRASPWVRGDAFAHVCHIRPTPRAMPWAKYCQPFRLGPWLLVFTLKG